MKTLEYFSFLTCLWASITGWPPWAFPAEMGEAFWYGRRQEG